MFLSVVINIQQARGLILSREVCANALDALRVFKRPRFQVIGGYVHCHERQELLLGEFRKALAEICPGGGRIAMNRLAILAAR